MTLTYVAWLSLEVRFTNVDALKIDSLALKIYRMVTTGFLVQNKLDRVWFFKKIFLLVNTSIEVVLEMPIHSLNNVDVEFTEARELIRKMYTVIKAIPTTQRVKLINKYNFVNAILDKNSEIFVIYVAILKASGIAIHIS